MYTEKQRDLSSSFVCTVIGILFCIGSFKYGSLRSGFPNAGYFPLLGGMILVVLSLISFVGSIRRKEGGEREKFFPQKYSQRRIGLFLVGLVAYSVALESLGFLLTTFGFLMFLFKCIEPQRWKTIVMASFLAATFSYVLFEIFLKVPLPHGILGNALR